MTWLTVMEYPCHKWPLICSTCRKHFSVLSSFMIYHRVCNKSNTTGATIGAGTAYPPWIHRLIHVFCEVRVAQSFVFIVVSWFVCSAPFRLGRCPCPIYDFWISLWHRRSPTTPITLQLSPVGQLVSSNISL